MGNTNENSNINLVLVSLSKKIKKIEISQITIFIKKTTFFGNFQILTEILNEFFMVQLVRSRQV